MHYVDYVEVRECVRFFFFFFFFFFYFFLFFFLMIRRPPRSTLSSSSAASDVYKRQLYKRCLELTPDYHMARHKYALALSKQDKFEAAMVEVNRLIEIDPNNIAYKTLHAAVTSLSLIHISEPTRLRRISYAVFCLKKKKK